MNRSVALSLVLLVAACGDPEPSREDTLACAYLEEGPYAESTATGFKDAQTPELTGTFRAHTITLPATGIGYVRFTAMEAGAHVIYLDRDVAFAVHDESSRPLAIDLTETSIEACTAVKAKHTVTLPGGLVYLALGPDSGGPVNLVIESQ